MAPGSILFALSHPAMLLFFQSCITTLVLMFTLRSSLIRPGTLVLILMGMYFSTSTYLERAGRVPWAAFLAGNTILGALQYVELGLLRSWTFDDEGRRLFVDRQGRAGEVERQGPRLRERLYFGYFVALSSRHIATPYEAKGVPCYSSSNPTYVPSRAQFLSKRLAISLSSYLVLDLVALGTRSQHAKGALFRPPAHIPLLARIGDVSWGELGMRMQDVVGYYVFCYCLIQCYTSLFACVVVALDVDKVGYWRPNFDSLGTSYSLRQFWGFVGLFQSSCKSRVASLI